MLQIKVPLISLQTLKYVAVGAQLEQTLNIEWDFKCCPVNPRKETVRHPVNGEVVGHLSFDTVHGILSMKV